jgi:hypothetical protein
VSSIEAAASSPRWRKIEFVRRDAGYDGAGYAGYDGHYYCE